MEQKILSILEHWQAIVASLVGIVMLVIGVKKDIINLNKLKFTKETAELDLESMNFSLIEKWQDFHTKRLEELSESYNKDLLVIEELRDKLRLARLEFDVELQEKDTIIKREKAINEKYLQHIKYLEGTLLENKIDFNNLRIK